MFEPFVKIILDSPESIPNENVDPPRNVTRIAIDSRGYIGSVYDAYEDQLRGKFVDRMNIQELQVQEQCQCELFDGTTAHRQNLLKFVRIDRELRLSILLELIDVVPTNGMGAVNKYPHLIDKQTRFLFLHQPFFKKAHGDGLHKLCKSVRKLRPEANVSHIITAIVYGIHALIILQLPTDQENEIHHLLSKMHQNLCCTEYGVLKLTADEETLLARIRTTTSYSNIPHLTTGKNLKAVYEQIRRLQMSPNELKPMAYILTPIPWFYGADAAKIAAFHPSKEDDVERLEILLLSRLSELKTLKRRLDCDLPELLQGKLEETLKQIQDKLSKLYALYITNIDTIRETLWAVRKGREKYSALNNAMNTSALKEIEKLSTTINFSMEQLESKGILVKRLADDGFEYCDMADFGINQNVTKELLASLLFANDPDKAVFFSHDTLRNANEKRWNELYSQMVRELKKDPKLHYVYADFTYSTYLPDKLEIVLPSNIRTKYDNLKTQISFNEIKQTKPSLQTPSSDGTINILLIGESGVGKSTFINAFANYLHFESLEQAQKGKPVVIIPVSFVLSVGDDFDEQIINFGDADANENHNNAGQSVTQQCKSYVFDISENRKLRIIDTPGFGDTRGSDQDLLNMEEIFAFLNNVPHLNAICFLFKPEVSQLNPFLRSCFTQLFDYFGEAIRQSLIFCFTNARSTFFAPGSTRPLLNAFFQSFPVKKIPFDKTNTFCFDSESFRYLVAIQADVVFDDIERVEIEQSWQRSVIESKRFRDYLCDRSSPGKAVECRSISDAQRRIKSMVRPMVEAIRHLLRNTVLEKQSFSIELSAIPISTPSICCEKKRQSKSFGRIRIQLDHLHSFMSTCTVNEHTEVEYRLEYKEVNARSAATLDQFKRWLGDLQRGCLEFSLFLMAHSSTPQNDPFFTTITKLVNDEEYICKEYPSCELNVELFKHLSKFKKCYEEELKSSASANKSASLSDI